MLSLPFSLSLSLSFSLSLSLFYTLTHTLYIYTHSHTLTNTNSNTHAHTLSVSPLSFKTSISKINFVVLCPNCLPCLSLSIKTQNFFCHNVVNTFQTKTIRRIYRFKVKYLLVIRHISLKKIGTMFLAVQLKIQFLSKCYSFCFGIKRFPSDYLNMFFCFFSSLAF